MVDCLSHGRLELGFGRGYQPHEFTGFGVTLEESHDRFEQAIGVVTQALAQDDDLSYATPLFKGEHASMAGLSTSGTLTHWFRDNLARELDPAQLGAIKLQLHQNSPQHHFPIFKLPDSAASVPRDGRMLGPRT